MDKQQTQISKFISLLLGHKPETIGLELDECGWANIEELITLSDGHGQRFDRSQLEAVVTGNDKQRFSISECCNFIRANQGHSFAVELNLEPQQPPTVLFHGTATRFRDSILATGLEKSRRQHVRMTVSRDIVTNVEWRHGKPLI